MKHCTLYISGLIFIVSSFTAIAETKVYHWVDEQGKSHFSDTAGPASGTKEITIGTQNLLLNDPTQAANSSQENTQTDDNAQLEKITYQATITSPLDNTPLRSNDGTINVHVETSPEKKSNHKLQLYLDGKALGEAQLSPIISAKNVARGTHQVQVDLLDEQGKLLAKTQVVTVHLQRALSVN